MFLVAGLLLGYLISRAKYVLLRAYTPVLYGLGIIGLVIVLIPGFGVEVNGIQAWIKLPGGFTIQPAEFAKLAIVLGMSLVLAETQHRDEPPSLKQTLFALSVGVMPVGLILLQPDLGTTLIIFAMMFVALVGAQVNARFLGFLAGAGIIGATILWMLPGFLATWQKERLLVFLDPGRDPQGFGYALVQVKLAIGSGGWTGFGLFNGPQTNGRFVPEQQTDYIFSAAGEQLGFLGSALIILLLFTIVWRALRIALQTTDAFARITAVGLAGWIAFQAFENIGMNLGIMPVTGVPLPFVSAGGTALMAFWMAIGLLQNVRNRQSE
jgi:rod shape determining protein RodA